MTALQDDLPFHDGRWRGVIHSALQLPPGGFDAWLDTLHHQALRDYDSRWIAECELPGCGLAFVKVLRGLGDDIHACTNALRWRFRPSRALHVWRISRQLTVAGFACAEVLLAARRRAWQPFGWPTDVLITRAAPGTALSDLLRSRPGDRPALLEWTAQALAALHAAGFVHGDCHPGNFFLDESSHRFCAIDNDRTKHLGGPWLAAGARRNLVQLGFHLRLDGLATAPEFQAFLDHYGAARQWAPDHQASLNRFVPALVAARLKRESAAPAIPQTQKSPDR